MAMLEYPLVKFFGYSTGRTSYEFLGREGKIEILGYNSKQLESILCSMNGHTPFPDIVQKLRNDISAETLKGMLITLTQAGVVIDSRCLFEQFHSDSANPSEFGYNLSNQEILNMASLEAWEQPDGDVTALTKPRGNLQAILKGRKSTREFSGAKLQMSELSGLLNSMYGSTISRPVPSAGGLYPYTLYVQILAGTQGLRPGLYRYCSVSNKIVFQKSIESYQLYSIFDSVSLCDQASVLILLVANLDYMTHKYANRGYRYALIEAGHVCQNGYLYAAQNNLGAVEIGGYQDEKLAAILSLDYPCEAVMSCLFVGRKSRKKTKESEIGIVECNELSRRMIQEHKVVQSVETIELKNRSYQPWFVAAQCSYRSRSGSKKDYSFATGRTNPEAQFKALAEAYERKASACLRYDVSISPSHLHSRWLDPRKYYPRGFQQVWSGMVPSPLDESKPMQWLWGSYLKGGKKILVPVDMVYYPLKRTSLGRDLVYRADSSGVAAHSNIAGATRNALHEVIERDALMLHWYCKIKPRKLPHEIAPDAVRASIRYWQGQNVSVDLLDITIDSLPVVLVAIHSSKMKPYFVTGAATGLNYESAIQKAFSEAEFMWFSWRAAKISHLQMQDIDHPIDHGMFYMRPEYRKLVGNLLLGKEEVPKSREYPNPVSLFDPIRVVLDTGDNPYGLCVVRVLSESLLPINFGFGTECRRHKRIEALGLCWRRRFPSQPHFFA